MLREFDGRSGIPLNRTPMTTESHQPDRLKCAQRPDDGFMGYGYGRLLNLNLPLI